MFNPGDKVLLDNKIELLYLGPDHAGRLSFKAPSMGGIVILFDVADVEGAKFFSVISPSEPKRLGTVYEKNGYTYVKADHLRVSWWCGKEQTWYSWQEIVDRPAPLR